jgi:hypothetical protein
VLQERGWSRHELYRRCDHRGSLAKTLPPFGHERIRVEFTSVSLSIVYRGRVTGNPQTFRAVKSHLINSTAKVHNGRDAGPIEYTLASHAALGAPRPREARVAQRRAPATKLWVSLFRQGGTHVRVEPSSRGASTRMRTRGTLARHQLAWVSGKRTCTHQQGGASPIRHGKAEKDGTPPRPSPGAHTACRDLGGLLQGLGLGVELAIVLAGGARVAAEEPAGRRHDTGRRRGAVRPLFCVFVFARIKIKIKIKAITTQASGSLHLG